MDSNKPWTMTGAGAVVDDEAAKDPGMGQPSHQVYTEKDFEGHRAHTVFVGVHVPGGGARRHSHRRHKHHHGRDGDDKGNQDPERPVTPPAARVQFILGEDVDDGTHESHPLFSEMEELVKEGDEIEWKETARWVKFEEDVEEGGNRWSKPHVATLSLHSLFELRSLLLNGTVMLDMEASSLEQIADLVCDNMISGGSLDTESREKVCEALLRRHRHQHEQTRKRDNNMSRLPIIRSLADIGKNHSSSKSLLQQQAQSTANATANGTESSPQRNRSDGQSSEDIHIKPTPSQAALFSTFSKDHRGNYLAVPTGELSLAPSQSSAIEFVASQIHKSVSSPALPAVASMALFKGRTSSKIVPNRPSWPNILTMLDPTPILFSPSYCLPRSLPSPPEVDDHQQHSTMIANHLAPANVAAPTVDNNGRKGLFVPGKSPSSLFALSSSGDDLAKSPSTVSMQRNASANELQGGGDPNQNNHRGNTHFMRKIPQGAEASNILVGEVDFLDKTLSAFIRLSQAAIMGDLTEVPVPTRFLFILLGPPGCHGSFHEIGRAMATLMSDEIFHEVAYRARKRDHLLAGIDEFLDAVTVLPPGEWDPTIRIEPPAAIPSQEVRKRPPEKHPPKEEHDEEEEEQKLREESGLSRSGRLFGGLLNDLKRKKPWYFSDFKDALSLQCVASWIFLYFACLSPIITFGGLLGEATGRNMAAMESLVSGFVCGMGYGFFSGQPLTVLGSTGPVLVFETIVYEFCRSVEWDYMSFRFCIGTWITIILLILVAVDASALVCYITRFTEENFATLIAFIFIYKAIENVLSIGKRFPINNGNLDCSCMPPATFNGTLIDVIHYNQDQCDSIGGALQGIDCNKPNVFLMSIILFMGTFITSIILKDFKNSLFFPANVRQVISDFSVIIAIFSMTILDALVGIATPKLEVPSELKPTLPGRSWVISPFNNNPAWSALVAILPAILGTILIFMDQQITAVIVNRKENKLKKGCGYHLDLFVLAILIQVCSIMGLPWFVAATVLSINHVNSLKLESECAAPGEKPQFLGVREQRVTHILIFFMIGCSVLLTPLLRNIPMPVLFGVFLYMGVASLKGLQFFDRILIVFMPVKYQPDYMFLRQVPLKRVHIFTLIQFACLVVLWLIKSFSSTSILFPLMLVVMIGIRKSLDCLFTRRELKILDDIMPEMSKRAAAEDLNRLEDGGEDAANAVPHPAAAHYASENIQISLANGGIMKIPIESINITEEVNKTTIWKQVNDEKTANKSGHATQHNSGGTRKSAGGSFKRYKNGKKQLLGSDLAHNEQTDNRLSIMTEEEETSSHEDPSKLAQNNTASHILSQKNAKNRVKELWIESKVDHKDVGNATETTV